MIILEILDVFFSSNLRAKFLNLTGPKRHENTIWQKGVRHDSLPLIQGSLIARVNKNLTCDIIVMMHEL